MSRRRRLSTLGRTDRFSKRSFFSLSNAFGRIVVAFRERSGQKNCVDKTGTRYTQKKDWERRVSDIFVCVFVSHRNTRTTADEQLSGP